MSPNSETAILWSSLGAYLEELAESGIDGFPAGETYDAPRQAKQPTMSEHAKQTTVAARSQADSAAPPENLETIRKNLGDCQRCKLGSTRKNLVYGAGNPQARLVFIGEAPDSDEDLTGEPFAGEAGLVFNRIISAMGMKREEIYICNVVKCHPPKGRDAESDEINTCLPFLLRQLHSIQPEVIVALGKCAAQVLLGTKEPITKLRGKFRDFHGIPLMPTLHPAHLLRNKGDAGPFWDVWDDMTQVLRLLKLPVPDKSRKS